MSEATVDALNEKVASFGSDNVAPITERIMERPLLSLGLAGLAGFMIGLGAASHTGAAMLMLIAQISLRRAATEAFASVITSYGTAKRNGSG